ncbi:hypothetical protein PFISCL1PPCAC_27919, partial [Pristionchus fissidentatus]
SFFQVMRLLAISLLVSLALVGAKFSRRFDENEESPELDREGFDDYDYEEPLAKHNKVEDDLDKHIKKKTGEILKKKKPADSETNEEEGKPQRNEAKAGKEDDKPIEICDGTREEACTCEENEVRCINIIFDDETFLETLDVILAPDNKKLKENKFKPIVARFADNIITKLKRNRMPEGMEEDLAELHLERNKISFIDKSAFDGFTNISKLNLARNRLRTVKSDWFLGDIEKTLHQLDLSSNGIHEMEETPFRRLTKLKKLVLDGNKLKLTANMFEGLENLETLSLDDCDISELPEGIFKPLKKLKALSLRGNPFVDVPIALEDVNHLKNLDLSETNINELHRQSFIDEPELEYIYFEQMPYLSAVQDCAFCGMKKLKVLTFHNCTRLVTIDENAFGFKEFTDDRTAELTELHISKTAITKVGLHMLEYDSLERLELSYSPLNCTCDIMFLKNIKLAGSMPTNARCEYPKAMKGKYLDQAQTKELCGSRYARGFRFFFALFGAISAAIIVTLGFILFNKGYRFTNISSLPLPSLPGTNSAYTNLNRQEENELTDAANTPDGTPDFQPRPQAV